MLLYLFCYIYICIVEDVNCTIIPLSYYSNRNLPFGINTTITGHHSATSVPFSKNIEFSINTNTPFTILFGLNFLNGTKQD